MGELVGEIENSIQMRDHFKGDALAKAYLFFGAEEYLKDLYIGRIKSKSEVDALNIYKFNTGADASEVSNVISSYSMFGNGKLIIVSGSGWFSGNSEVDLNFLSELYGSDTTLIIRERKVDKRKVAYKTFLKYGIAFDCASAQPSDVKKVIAMHAAKQNVFLDANAAELLVSGFSTDMNMLLNQVDKLVLASRNGKIDENLVRENTHLSLDCKIFDLQDACALGNTGKALEYLHKFLDDREAPVMILYVLNKYWLNMYYVKLYLSAGLYSQEIMKIMGLKEYPLSKFTSQSKKYSFEQIKEKIQKGMFFDEQMKNGSIKDTVALELLVI